MYKTSQHKKIKKKRKKRRKSKQQKKNLKSKAHAGIGISTLSSQLVH